MAYMAHMAHMAGHKWRGKQGGHPVSHSSYFPLLAIHLYLARTNAMPVDQNPSTLPVNWSLPNHTPTKTRAQDCLIRVNWEAICDVASRSRAQTCQVRPECTSGGSSLARLLEFQDGTLWVARVQLKNSTSKTSSKAQTDIDTMAFLKNCTKTPIPQVFASQIDDNNPAGVAFLLLEFFPGNTAFDENRLSNNRSLIPPQFQNNFYSSIAAAHVR